MNICWLLGPDSATYAGLKDTMHEIAPLWGSHDTWRDFDTDHCIVHDLSQARTLVKRAFHSVTKMYIPDSNFVDLGRPLGVQMYGGGFDGEVNHKDSVIAAHLVGNLGNALVLMIGWDLSAPTTTDQLEKHRQSNFLRSIKTVIHNHPDTQWVLVEPDHETHKEILEQDNFTEDSLESVMQLLGHTDED